MANTIELLESIGRNAALRHATGPDLEKLLDDMHASDEFKRAASTGDIEHLKLDLGDKSMGVNQTPANGTCEEDEEEGGKEPDQDDRDDENKS